ncbi:hypothetical protein PVAG01_02142 [Phlyctema vagabunda]|uniref:Lebercilin domain-containing protein n=1 Tax=Phlyctema vagabunda TaxID=108571 RepID=A0ABR4PPZ2_9HELO
MDPYKKLKCWQCQNELRSRGLPTSGILGDLQRRLREDDERRCTRPQTAESKNHLQQQKKIATDLRKLHEEVTDPGGVRRLQDIESKYKERHERESLKHKTENDKLQLEIERLQLDIRKLKKKMKDNDTKAAQDQEKVDDLRKSRKMVLARELNQEKEALRKREELLGQYNALNSPNIKPARLEEFRPGKDPVPIARKAAPTEQKPKLEFPSAANTSSVPTRMLTPSSAPPKTSKHPLESPGNKLSQKNLTKPPGVAKSPSASSMSYHRDFSRTGVSPPAKRRQTDPKDFISKSTNQPKTAPVAAPDTALPAAQSTPSQHRPDLMRNHNHCQSQR